MGRSLNRAAARLPSKRVACDAGLKGTKIAAARAAGEPVESVQYRRLVESIAGVPYSWDMARRRFHYVGPQAKAITGFPPSKWREDGFWLAHVHPDDLPMAQAAAQLRARERRNGKIEYRFNVASGRTIWLRDTITFPAQEDDSTAYGLIVDITQQKLVEQAIESSEIRYRVLMESMELIPYSYNLEADQYTYLGPQAGRLLGFSLEAWNIQGFRKRHIHPGDKAIVDQRWREHCLTRQPGRLEYRLTTKDGESVWVSDVFGFEADASGHMAAFGFMIEITGQKRVEQALREGEKRFRHLVESANVIPYARGVTDDQMLYIGPQASRILGYSVEKLGAPGYWLSCIHPEDRQRIQEVSENSKIGAEHESEFRVIAADQRTVWLRDIWKREVSENGDPIDYGFAFDITESKRREEQLIQAQKMESVGQMTGGVAHDFNNLLTVIVGNLDLLSPSMETDPKAKRRLDLIRFAADRGAELTRALLAFSRRQPLEPKPTDMNALITGMSELLARTLGSPIEISLRTATDLWLTDVDPAQLESALVNLAVNASDAMPNGGTLHIETANQWLETAHETPDAVGQPYVMLAVSDTGQGMTSDVLARVFEPFFTTKEVGRGTGLGLSMVYGFVKQSGGMIDIESTPGAGTTVRIHLPRAKAKA